MSNLSRSDALDVLLGLPSPQFIKSCYESVLFREADPEGLAHSLARLHAGEDKLSIAADIASSEEASALPSSRRILAGEILALHAGSLIRRAWTPKQRDAVARRVQRYFSCLTEAVVVETPSIGDAPGSSPSDEGDPFASYFATVINDRDQ